MVKIIALFFTFVLGGLIVIACYSQLISPLIKGTPIFSFFRKRPNIRGEIEKINESLEDKEMRKKLGKKQKELDK